MDKAFFIVAIKKTDKFLVDFLVDLRVKHAPSTPRIIRAPENCRRNFWEKGEARCLSCCLQ